MRPERDFLHDISTPLTVAHGQTRLTLDFVGRSATLQEDAELTAKLNKIMAALDTVKRELDHRRSELREEP